MMVARYAVFGNPIAHSKSPDIHALFAQQENVLIQYDRILVDEHEVAFNQALRDFFAQGGQGANITVPFKTMAYNWVDELSPRAQAAGAVNTLIPLGNNRFRGDNTDGIGLVKDITENLKYSLENKKILILGAGGAARGVIVPLLEQKPQQIVIANRTESKAIELAKQFSIQARTFEELADGTDGAFSFDLMINATSGSLTQQMPDVPIELFSAVDWVYDMVYGKELTSFLKFAQENGAKNVADGLGMLVCQAAYAYELWRGFAPETASVIASMRA